METIRWKDLIRYQGSNGEITVETLQQWVKEYPWCQSLHLLLAKRMFDTSHPLFHDHLVHSAIRVADRTILWQLLYANRFQSPDFNPEALVEPGEPATENPENIAPADPANAIASGEPAAENLENIVPSDLQNATEPEEPAVKPRGTELIEKFIQAEPRIVPREGDYAETMSLAEKSNIPVYDLVTETLANVYLQQGNKGRAIKIFEKLSLSIPEKSSYFAARIKEIRNLSNSL